MRFEFATATRILFGPGVLKEVGPSACEMGKRALLLVGLPEEHLQPLFTSLKGSLMSWVSLPVNTEPTIDLIRQGLEVALREGCDMTIGCGGGSAMDTAKAVAAMLTNGGDPLDYVEVIGRGQALVKASAPCITIPSTAGTGAEVTRNAVLGAPGEGVKVSLRSATMLPRLALVDPTLTYQLPPEITANTGLDALTQLVEPYVSNKANPITDALCREGMQMVARALQQAYLDGTNEVARQEMSLASLFGGLALANAGLGGAHGFAGPIGGMFTAPHGAVCARMLPFVTRSNLNALRQRLPDSPILKRYAEVAQLLTGDLTASAEQGVIWMFELCKTLKVRPLRDYGATQADIPMIVSKAAQASSMKANPVLLTSEELSEILQQAL